MHERNISTTRSCCSASEDQLESRFHFSLIGLGRFLFSLPSRGWDSGFTWRMRLGYQAGEKVATGLTELEYLFVGLDWQ